MLKSDGGFIREEYNDEKVSIYVIDIKEISDELKQTMDEFIVSICEGPQETILTIDDVKQEIKNFILEKRPKSDNDTGRNSYTYIGAIAEFFIHLFLNYIGCKQECLYFNLEERSIKKGFDGCYSFEDKTWIMESKSGYENSEGATHTNKLQTSYKQLKEKITSSNPSLNNPWRNALNHAKIVASNKDILKELQIFSQQYIRGEINNNIEDFNLIPCSTIYYMNNWEENKSIIIENIKDILNNIKCKNLKIICINKHFKKLFLEYLGVNQWIQKQN